MGNLSNLQKPQIFNSKQDLDQEIKVEYDFIDIFDKQIAEINEINLSGSISPPTAVFIYYPWKKVVLKTVNQASLTNLRTNRNKLLITESEQQKLLKTRIGIAGMSVGSSIASALAYSGISDYLKIADKDNLETANLNRLRESLLSVGLPKVELAARNIYEINPFGQLDIFSQGITSENINQFLHQPKLDLVVDEIDDFKMKVQIRIEAKKAKIPVIMLTSLGDNILFDIERFDIEPDRPIFHGLIDESVDEILNNPNITTEDIKKYSVALVGAEYIPTKALMSVMEIGKSLVGRPQLYSTIAVDGGMASYLIRSIILNDKPKSGRYFLKFNEVFNIDGDLENTQQRTQLINILSGAGGRKNETH